MDAATSDIRAVEFTPSRDGDSPVLPELLNQIPESEEIGTVTADGACDRRRCHAAIIERDSVHIIPIRKNGRPWKEDCLAARVRNETLHAIRHYGRAFCARWAGHVLEGDHGLRVCKWCFLRIVTGRGQHGDWPLPLNAAVAMPQCRQAAPRPL